MVQDISYLDPKVLAGISNLELRAKTAVEGFLAGLHRSPHRGFSVEFTEYRRYNPGDDIRHVDWKAYARSGEYFIRQYEDETNVRCHILLDCSASIGYGSDSLTKLEYGRTLASALSYFMFGQRDAVGLTTFDSKVREHLPSRYRQGHLMQILRTLAHLQHLRFKGNDVIVFHIMDNAELTFPFDRIAEFEDAENHERLAVAPPAIRETYLREVDKFCSFYRQKCHAGGIDYCLLNTAEPLDMALSSYLSKRARSY
jgi:uncharacterized protein (DUF58 family)